MEFNNEYDNPANTLTLDQITGQFGVKTQRQEYYEPKPEPADDDIPPSLTDPTGEAAAESPDLDFMDEHEPQEEISPERYQRTGLRIAKAVDTGFNFIASNFIANGSEKEYKADKADLQDLGEAWGELAQEKRWDMSPVWQVLVLSAMVYIPLAKEAFNDRRIMALEAKQNDQEDRIKYLENELYRRSEAERKAADAAASPAAEA